LPSGVTINNGNWSGTGLALANLASEAANTVLGALTATTPSALAVPSCSGASNALIWTSGTGFGCNTISASGLTFPVTVSGTTTSGGIPYFSGTTVLTSSGLLTAGAVVVGGGAGSAPSTNGAATLSGAAFTLGTQGTTQGSLVFANTNVGAYPTTLQSSNSATAAQTITLPVAPPTVNGQVLSATTAGVTSWTAQIGSKALSMMSPQSGDNDTLFFTSQAHTISNIYTVIQGSGTPSITITYYYGTNRSSGTAILTGGITTTSTTSVTTTPYSSLTNGVIPANNFVWAVVTALSGTVTEAGTTIEFSN
jgi:hypothetical protein